jgi:hypothetical protein
VVVDEDHEVEVDNPLLQELQIQAVEAEGMVP